VSISPMIIRIPTGEGTHARTHTYVPATYAIVPIDNPSAPISDQRPPFPRTESSTLIGTSCDTAAFFGARPPPRPSPPSMESTSCSS
jgi:hypothetical protein